MRVLLNAASFGYGPVAKMAAVAKALVAADVHCVFCGSGIALEYFARERICKAMEIDLYEQTPGRVFRDECLQFDYGLSAGEPRFVSAVQRELPVGYIDSLCWMWTREHFEQYPALLNVRHYFVQRAFDSMQAARARGVKHPIAVGAIVDIEAPSSREHCAVVLHLGGVANTFVRPADQHYPTAVVQCVVDALAQDRSRSVVVATSRDVAARLSRRSWSTHVDCASLTHREFIGLVRSCNALITSPGLTAFLECCSIEVPVVFLPPQNYSQALILKRLADDGYPGMSSVIESMVAEVEEGQAEEPAVESITRAINSLAADSAMQTQLGAELVAQLGDPLLLQRRMLFQRDWLGRLGVDGVESIVDVVLGEPGFGH